MPPGDPHDDVTTGLQQDMYGQLHPVETPELLRRKLEALRTAVAQATELPHVQESLRKAPKQLTDEFYLRFLRSVLFHIPDTLSMLERYWSKRKEIYGQQKAFCPMTIKGVLTEQDTAALEHGYLRFVPGVGDDRGRGVVYIDASLHEPTKYTKESLCRVLFYVLHHAVAQESIQRHGLVLLIDLSRAYFKHWDRKYVSMLIGSMASIAPGRIAAFNLIRPPTFCWTLIPVAKMFLSEILRKRIYCYAGTNEKIVQKFAKVHFPPEALPVEIGGTVEINYHEWLNEQRKKEENESSGSTSSEPPCCGAMMDADKPEKEVTLPIVQ